MREYTRGPQMYVSIGGAEFEYDGVIKIYSNSATGSCMINTNLVPEAMCNILAGALDHAHEDGDLIPSEMYEGGMLLMPAVQGDQ